MIIKIAFGHNTESLRILNKSILDEYKSELRICENDTLQKNNSKANNLKNEISKLTRYDTYCGSNILYKRICGYNVYSNIDFLSMLYPLDVYNELTMKLIVENIAMINYKVFDLALIKDFIVTLEEIVIYESFRIKKKVFDELLIDDAHFVNYIKCRYHNGG